MKKKLFFILITFMFCFSLISCDFGINTSLSEEKAKDSIIHYYHKLSKEKYDITLDDVEVYHYYGEYNGYYISIVQHDKVQFSKYTEFKYIDDIEFIYLKNGIITELWIRDYLPKIINNDLNELYSGLFKELPILTFNDYNKLLANGAVLIMINDKSYAVFLSFPPKRGLTDSLCDPSNLFGSRDGFNEIIADNRILIRRRIKTNNLIFEELFLGDKTECEINLVYLKKNKHTANLIKKQLILHKNHNITSVLDLNSILSNNSIVPNFIFTGSPETCANSLLKDKVVILIDNSPIAVIVPGSLLELTENSNETNGFNYAIIFNRIFVLIFLFISIFLIGLFVLLTSHHPEALSLLFITNFQLSERGTTFPLFIEILIK